MYLRLFSARRFAAQDLHARWPAFPSVIIHYFRVIFVTLVLPFASLSADHARAAGRQTAEVQTITGQGVATVSGQAAGKSKRAGKFKLKRRGEPWEVRIVTADGREQIYRGYRERSPKRDANPAPGSVRDGEERRGLRVMRLQLPASP